MRIILFFYLLIAITPDVYTKTCYKEKSYLGILREKKLPNELEKLIDQNTITHNEARKYCKIHLTYIYENYSMGVTDVFTSLLGLDVYRKSCTARKAKIMCKGPTYLWGKIKEQNANNFDFFVSMHVRGGKPLDKSPSKYFRIIESGIYGFYRKDEGSFLRNEHEKIRDSYDNCMPDNLLISKILDGEYSKKIVSEAILKKYGSQYQYNTDNKIGYYGFYNERYYKIRIRIVEGDINIKEKPSLILYDIGSERADKVIRDAKESLISIEKCNREVIEENNKKKYYESTMPTL
jgi:hypothetical protein